MPELRAGDLVKWDPNTDYMTWLRVTKPIRYKNILERIGLVMEDSYGMQVQVWWSGIQDTQFMDFNEVRVIR